MDTINNIKDTANAADALSKKLKEQLKDYKIEVSTETEYASLETKDGSTLYFCTEDETI